MQSKVPELKQGRSHGESEGANFAWWAFCPCGLPLFRPGGMPLFQLRVPFQLTNIPLYQFLRAPFRQRKNRCECIAKKRLIDQDSRFNTYKVLQANVVRFVTVPGRGFRGIELVSRIFAVIQRSNRGIHLQKRTHNTQLIRNSCAINLNNIPESRRTSWCDNSSGPIKQSIKMSFFDNRSGRLIRSINQSTERFAMKVYAWLIDLIHRRKNFPTGMISGWVQKVTEHQGTIQYCTD